MDHEFFFNTLERRSVRRDESAWGSSFLSRKYRSFRSRLRTGPRPRRHRYWVPRPRRDFNHTGIDKDDLDSFCNSTDFLTAVTMFKDFGEQDHATRAQQVYERYLGHRSSLFLTRVLEAQRQSDGGPPDITSDEFRFCPVVCDAGASYGLTPFIERIS